MPFFTFNRLIFCILATAMLVTRLHHVGSVPDASWAVLFLGGFYLRGPGAFAALMLEAAAIDYIATQHLGVSSYCLSPAYAMLLPSYAALWLGGAWAHRHWKGPRALSVVEFSMSLLISVSFCFLLSNGSFYWLSGRASSPNFAGWLVSFRQWYPHFLLIPCAYVGVTAMIHMSARWLRRILRGSGSPHGDADVIRGSTP
jgi:hypothetical protein